jgi:hypothetical protein
VLGEYLKYNLAIDYDLEFEGCQKDVNPIEEGIDIQIMCFKGSKAFQFLLRDLLIKLKQPFFHEPYFTVVKNNLKSNLETLKRNLKDKELMV